MKVGRRQPWHQRAAKKAARFALLASLGLVLAFPFFFHGCSGANQATPIDTGGPSAPVAAPAPPAEIPSILRFVGPGDLKIDVSSLTPSASAELAKATLSGAAGMDIQGFVNYGTWLIPFFDAEFAAAIDGIQELAIPITDPATGALAPVTTFDNGGKPFAFSSATGILAGTRHVKIDFADFDFANSGTTAGCSGTQAALPVCVRMWIDDNDGNYRPFIAGVFDGYPFYNDDGSLKTLGQGRFKLAADVTLETDPVPVGLTVQYSYRPKTNLQLAANADRSKEVEYAFWGDQPPADPAGRNMYGHLLFAFEEGAALTELKTVNLSLFENYPAGPPPGSADIQFTGQFVEGDPYFATHDLWSVGSDTIDIAPPYDCATRNNPLCAKPNDYCLVADRTACASRGADLFNILTDGIDFFGVADLVEASFLDSAPWAFPVDFPQAPTF